MGHPGDPSEQPDDSVRDIRSDQILADRNLGRSDFLARDKANRLVLTLRRVLLRWIRLARRLLRWVLLRWVLLGRIRLARGLLGRIGLHRMSRRCLCRRASRVRRSCRDRRRLLAQDQSKNACEQQHAADDQADDARRPQRACDPA